MFSDSDAENHMSTIDFRTEPARYKHWKLAIDGAVATIAMDVDERGGLRPDYELKLNSYDLAVDIELYDCIQRLRFGNVREALTHVGDQLRDFRRANA